jgi:hypothetical protein
MSTIACPGCLRRLRLAHVPSGGTVTCPICQRIIDVAEPEPLPAQSGLTTPTIVVAGGSLVLLLAASLVIAVALWPTQPTQVAEQPAGQPQVKQKYDTRPWVKVDEETVLLIALFFLYPLIASLPGAVAFFRRHPNRVAILAMGLLLGWSFVGWALAMMWSLTDKGERIHVHHYHR